MSASRKDVRMLWKFSAHNGSCGSEANCAYSHRTVMIRELHRRYRVSAGTPGRQFGFHGKVKHLNLQAMTTKLNICASQHSVETHAQFEMGSAHTRKGDVLCSEDISYSKPVETHLLIETT